MYLTAPLTDILRKLPVVYSNPDVKYPFKVVTQKLELDELEDIQTPFYILIHNTDIYYISFYKIEARTC
jgi:hypothetical protein